MVRYDAWFEFGVAGISEVMAPSATELLALGDVIAGIAAWLLERIGTLPLESMDGAARV